MVGRAGLEPATICGLNLVVCQADILTRLDDRPKVLRDCWSQGNKGYLGFVGVCVVSGSRAS